ncbi:MAG: ferritin-like domain-containing protein [Chloroflexota bacterium]|nr:ferritin-like domain-containing protein [Chloroflexota bacterium]
MTHPVMQLSVSRRGFMRNSALLAVGSALAATALSNGTAFASAQNAPLFQSAAQDLDILNYALTLEHLESAGYKAINASGLLSGVAAQYFQDFGAHEATHVDVLTQTINSLGGTPVKAQASYNFPAFKSADEVLVFFRDVEELGAAAYLAQAPRLQNGDLLTAAVSIHNVEAQHAAALNDLTGVAPSPAFGTPKSMEEVLAVVTPLLMAPGTVPTEMPPTGRGGMQRRRHAMQAR